MAVVTFLIGRGGHGKDIEAIAKRAFRPVVVWDDADPEHLLAPPIDAPTILGVNEPDTRWKMAARYRNAAPALVDPAARIGPNVSLAGGCVVGPGAILLHTVNLGKHTHVNYAATMTRCTVGAFTTIGPAVTVCGDVRIGWRVFVGAGAVICNLIEIGDNAVIGAGAIVTRDVPAGVTVVSPSLRAVRPYCGEE